MKYLFFIYIALLSVNTYSQQIDSKYNYGIQLQLSPGYSTFGCIGFSGAINLDMIRNKSTISPYISFGSYTSNYMTDVREINFKELVSGVNIFYNLIAHKYFKVKAGTGITISYLNGLKEEWNGWYGEVHFEKEIINEISAGGNLIAGVRVGNIISVEILPIYFSIGLSDKKYTPRIGIGYEFKNTKR